MKKSIFTILLLIVSVAVFSYAYNNAQSETRPYYSGEAVNYNGTVYFGTTNSGVCELFHLENSNIVRQTEIISNDNNDRKFHDLAFQTNDSRLYLYLVNGTYLSKYDITDPNNYRLVNKKHDNSKDYFYAVNQANQQIVTVGNKGVKIWNEDLDVINSFDVPRKFGKAIKISDSGKFLFNTNDGRLQVTDIFRRYAVLDKNLNTAAAQPHVPFVEEVSGEVFLVDDYSLKKIDIEGNYQEFKHTSDIGYDADGLDGQAYVYFSDGIGIVKIRKTDMKPVDWAYTTSLAGSNGWAMGLRVVPDYSSEKIIVFNGSNILVFNNSLDLIDSVAARSDDIPAPRQLFLSLSDHRGAPGAYINLSGQGFGSNENLSIYFGFRYKTSGITDKNGNFQRQLLVPMLPQGNTDIKVVGDTSGRTYSVSFYIQ